MTTDEDTLDTFEKQAKMFGTVPLLHALSDTWQVVGSYLGLSGGFSFFVLMSSPAFQDNQVISAELSEIIVLICLSTSFACAYLGSGLCMTFIGNAAYLIRMSEANQCKDSQLHDFIKKTEYVLSIPAYTNFIVTALTMLSLAMFSFSNYPPAVSITFAGVATLVTVLGFYFSKIMMDSRVHIMSKVQMDRKLESSR